MAQRKYLFGSKGGFGYYPITIIGWIITIIYFVSLIYIFIRISSTADSLGGTLLSFAPFLFGATVILLFICYLTGQPIKRDDLKI
ncbi:MAG TPA: hypothetical protein VG917_02125 [Patescibacteria group bacterium]|nr:hypothetical protein [Patescibacteria group bacterium]